MTALIIGAGNRGQTYARCAEHAPDQLRVGGVAEPRGPQREALARRYGLAAGHFPRLADGPLRPARS